MLGRKLPIDGSTNLRRAYRLKPMGSVIGQAKALLEYGVDGPERLLLMDPRVIRCIPGVGDFCMKEIELYRARFSH